jgi:hypothetical protein
MGLLRSGVVAASLAGFLRHGGHVCNRLPPALDKGCQKG